MNWLKIALNAVEIVFYAAVIFYIVGRWNK